MIYYATVSEIPYLEVRARNDDEARRRVIERCRWERADGFCKRWKSCGMAVIAKQSTNREEKRNARSEVRTKALRV